MIHHSQVRFIPNMQGSFNISKSINVTYHQQAKEEILHIKRYRKKIDNIQYPFMIFKKRNSWQIWNREELLQFDKEYLQSLYS